MDVAQVSTQLSLNQAILATFVGTIVIFGTRAFPFILFSKKQPPAIIRFIEKHIPPMIMAMLLVYCFKDVKFSQNPFGLPHLIALVATIVLHVLKNNTMLSIFGGTILFMILQRVI